ETAVDVARFRLGQKIPVQVAAVRALKIRDHHDGDARRGAAESDLFGYREVERRPGRCRRARGRRRGRRTGNEQGEADERQVRAHETSVAAPPVSSTRARPAIGGRYSGFITTLTQPSRLSRNI